MDVIKKIQFAQKDILFITTSAHKKTILKAMHESGVIHPVSFIDKQDLLEKVFFKYSIDVTKAASDFVGKSPSIVSQWLEYLYYISEEHAYNSPRLSLLQSLKTHLKNNGKIQHNIFSNAWIKNKQVIVYGPIYDIFFKRVIKQVENLTDDIEYLDSPHPHQNNITFTSYHSMEDEIIDVAKKIRDLRKEGTPYQSIKIANVPPDYQVSMKRIFAWFDIPLNQNIKRPLMSFPLTKTFFDAFNIAPTDSFPEALEIGLKTIHPLIQSQHAGKIYQKIISTLNPMVRYMHSKTMSIPFVTHAIQTTSVPLERWSNGVEIINEVTPVKAEEILFLMALKEGNAPTYKQDDDFLSAEEKEMIEYPTAFEENKLSKTQYSETLKHSNIVYASYSESSFSETFKLASHVDSLIPTFKQEKGRVNVEQPYSEKTDMLLTKFEKDTYDLYKVQGAFYKAFYNKFNHTFNTYTNQFSTLSPSTMNELIKMKPSFSVTQIEDYFKCGLTFLLKHFLKISPKDSPFYRHLGTFFHDVLEHHITKETLSEYDLETILQAILKDDIKHYTKKDLFFFRKPFPIILKAHDIIKKQEALTHYTVKDRELKVAKSYTFNGKTVEFKGKIDKVLYKDKSILLIDYKTGDKTLDIRHAPYGINSQLLFYALLYQSVDRSSEVDGFYEQTILPKTIKSKDGHDYDTLLEEYFKWQGYTIKDINTVQNIDPNFDKESQLIHNVKLTEKDNFNKNSKVIERDTLTQLIAVMETRLKEATNNIINGEFPINPKRINATDVSCKYCPFASICYKKEQDYVQLHAPKKAKTLFDSLKEGDSIES